MAAKKCQFYRRSSQRRLIPAGRPMMVKKSRAFLRISTHQYDKPRSVAYLLVYVKFSDAFQPFLCVKFSDIGRAAGFQSATAGGVGPPPREAQLRRRLAGTAASAPRKTSAPPSSASEPGSGTVVVHRLSLQSNGK